MTGLATFFFIVLAIGALAGAIGVVTVRNPFFSVLALVTHLISLAGLFLMLRAQFVAAAQVVVYAGAVMVLYVFVVAYVGGQEEPGFGGTSGRLSKTLAIVFGLALLTELLVAVAGSGLEMLSGHGAPFNATDPNGYGTPGQIGRLLLTKFLFPFEASSLLLIVAAVGAIVLARRRGGVHGPAEPRLSVADLLRPRGTGTMLEGVTGLTGTPRRSLEPPSSDAEEVDREREDEATGVTGGGGGGW